MDASAATLADLPLRELLARLAARTPAPAGGSATAVTCALAASLVEMAASFALARPELADRHERIRELKDRAAALQREALALAERELEAYAPVLEALRLPTRDPTRPARLDAGLSGAAEPPLALASVGAELAGLGAEIARAGNPNLAGDAIAATLLAEAACRSAVCLVELNLAASDGQAGREASAPDARRGAATADVRRAWHSRLQALGLHADTPRTEN